MAISTRQDLADYALRALGAPVIQINIADEQIDDRIDEALQKYWEFHSDGSIKSFLVHKITSKNLTDKWILIPENVLSVLRVFPYGSTSSNNLQYTAYMSDVLSQMSSMGTGSNSGFVGANYSPGGSSNGNGGLGNYMINNQYLSTINSLFNYEKPVRFNRHMDRLFIDADWSTIGLDQYIAIECTVIVDPDEFDRAWNDMWLKKYVIALFKRQWGQNMIKYDGFQLPSGMTLNGRQMYDDALADIELLDDELINTYQYPIDWFVG